MVGSGLSGCLYWKIREGKREKSMSWEVIPFRAAVPVIPEFRLDFEPSTGDEATPVAGGHTGQIQLASIEETTSALLLSYRRRVERGDRHALGELLDLNPQFILVEWVAERVARYAETERSVRRPGRPRGSYRRSPLYVIGLVEHLVRSKRAGNAEQAFHWLAERECLSYERVKALYYQGRNDSRVRASLISHPIGIGLSSPPEEQVQAWLAETGWLPKESAAIITKVGVVAINRRLLSGLGR